MSVFCLGADECESLWHRYAHHLERLERESGLVLAQAIRIDLRMSLKQLWGFKVGDRIEGVAVTQVYETPRGKCCEVYGACGTESAPGQIAAIINEIEKWAAEIGCTRTRLLGRRGWARKLDGYEQTGIILEKEI